jgi:hypothetical protein
MDGVTMFDSIHAERQVAEFQALMPRQLITPNESVVFFEDAYETGLNPHFPGRAYFTFHRYGVQVHRSEDDARRWNAQQSELRPVSGR